MSATNLKIMLNIARGESLGRVDIGKKEIRSGRCFSSKSAAITKIHRNTYPQHYLTKIVQPDGSSFTIRFNDPRMIIRLPLDMNLISEEERKRRIEARRPKQKVKIVEELDDSFDRTKYLKYFKK